MKKLLAAGLLSLIVSVSVFANEYVSYENADFSDGLAAIRFETKSRWLGIIDKSGKWVIPPFKADDHFYKYYEGLFPFKINGEWNYIDQKGRTVINTKEGEVTPFYEGLAGVKINQKWGFFDKAGAIVIDPAFQYNSKFSEGLALVKVNGKYGYINKSGEFIISPKFDEGRDFSEGLAMIKTNGKYGYIDKDGSFIIEPQFDSYAGDFLGGAARVQIGENPDFFINKKGNNASDVIFSAIGDFHEGLASAQINKDGKYGYIDNTFKFKIQPQFDDPHDFSDGLARVAIGEKYGYIDRTGKVVVKPRFAFAEDFHDGFASVHLENKNFKQENQKYREVYINKKGEVAIDPSNLVAATVAKINNEESGGNSKLVASFRKSMIEGDETNCGPVIEVKGKLIKVSFPVANYGNEHWIRRDEIFPSGFGCRFVNGRYQLPEME